MNPPEIKNVTPANPLAPVAPAGSVATAAPVAPGPAAAVAVAAKPQPLRRIGAIVALVVLLLAGYALTRHHANSYESTADAVTMAIVNNNMTPVESSFNAIRRPQLEDRARVGRLSEMLVPLGAFKGSKEITPPDAKPGLHEFTETFASGTKFEKYELDADGKIAQFYIGDPPSSSSP